MPKKFEKMCTSYFNENDNTVQIERGEVQEKHMSVVESEVPIRANTES